MLVVDLVTLTLITTATKVVHGQGLRGGVSHNRLSTVPRIRRISTRYYKRRRVYRHSDLLTTIDGRVRCCSSRRLSGCVNATPSTCAPRRRSRFHSIFCAVRSASMTK